MTGILERTRSRFRDIVRREHLLGERVRVRVGPLTAEEAIGAPERRDFPIIIGKERVVEAEILGSRGHAYTDSPRTFEGTLEQVLDLELTGNRERAVFVSVLNAVMAHLGLVTATVHCRDDEPERCAVEIAARLHDRYGKVSVGLIGLNPAIAERLIDVFGEDRVLITDLAPDSVGKTRFGVEVRDGGTFTNELIDRSDLVLLTGTTLVNATFDAIRSRIETAGKTGIVYGVTAAGAENLMGFERMCPCGRDG
ncbi:MAG: hypothetical protein JRG91_07455 [Deltaproteobacteria bacterium]|nr:hypothetical protein [Deltaproteobacteria bacterium]